MSGWWNIYPVRSCFQEDHFAICNNAWAIIPLLFSLSFPQFYLIYLIYNRILISRHPFYQTIHLENSSLFLYPAPECPKLLWGRKKVESSVIAQIPVLRLLSWGFLLKISIIFIFCLSKLKQQTNSAQIVYEHCTSIPVFLLMNYMSCAIWTDNENTLFANKNRKEIPSSWKQSWWNSNEFAYIRVLFDEELIMMYTIWGQVWSFWRWHVNARYVDTYMHHRGPVAIYTLASPIMNIYHPTRNYADILYSCPFCGRDCLLQAYGRHGLAW